MCKCASVLCTDHAIEIWPTWSFWWEVPDKYRLTLKRAKACAYPVGVERAMKTFKAGGCPIAIMWFAQEQLWGKCSNRLKDGEAICRQHQRTWHQGLVSGVTTALQNKMNAQRVLAQQLP